LPTRAPGLGRSADLPARQTRWGAYPPGGHRRRRAIGHRDATIGEGL